MRAFNRDEDRAPARPSSVEGDAGASGQVGVSMVGMDHPSSPSAAEAVMPRAITMLCTLRSVSSRMEVRAMTRSQLLPRSCFVQGTRSSTNRMHLLKTTPPGPLCAEAFDDRLRSHGFSAHAPLLFAGLAHSEIDALDEEFPNERLMAMRWDSLLLDAAKAELLSDPRRNGGSAAKMKAKSTADAASLTAVAARKCQNKTFRIIPCLRRPLMPSTSTRRPSTRSILSGGRMISRSSSSPSPSMPSRFRCLWIMSRC